MRCERLRACCRPPLSTLVRSTGGVGTTDMVLGATRATGNCINNHGVWGCGRAASTQVAHAVHQVLATRERPETPSHRSPHKKGYDASRACFAERGASGCLGHAAAATGSGLWSMGRGLTTVAANSVRALGSGLASGTASVARVGRRCFALLVG